RAVCPVPPLLFFPPPATSRIYPLSLHDALPIASRSLPRGAPARRPRSRSIQPVSRRGWALLLAVGVVWGTPYFLIKIAVAEVSPAAVVLARTVVGALVLLPFALRRGGFGVLRGRWGAVVGFAGLEIVGPWFFISSAERDVDSGTAGLLI